MFNLAPIVISTH